MRNQNKKRMTQHVMRKQNDSNAESVKTKEKTFSHIKAATLYIRERK